VLEGRVLMAMHTWTGAGATDNWSDVANWAEGAAPSATEADAIVVFNSADPLSVNDIPSLRLSQLRFDAGSSVTLRLDVALSILVNQSGTESDSEVVHASAQQNLITGPAGLNFLNAQAAEISVAAGGTLDLGVAVSYASPQVGSRYLEKLGPGTLRFSGSASNDLTGRTSVNVSEGTLVLQKTGGATAVGGKLTIRHWGTVPSVVVLGADEQIDDDGLLELQGTSSQGSKFDLNGHTETVGFYSISSFVGLGSVIDLSNPESHLIIFGNGGSFNGTVVGSGTFTVAGGGFMGFVTPMKNDVTFEILNGGILFHGQHDLKAVTLAGAGSKVTFNYYNSKDNYRDTPVTRLRSLSLGEGASVGIFRGGLILDYEPGQSPLVDVRRAIPNFDKTYTVPHLFFGYAENDPAAGGLGLKQFLGQDVDASSVLIRYTLAGDADLDGAVGPGDFNLLASHFAQTGRSWTEGDFNYDGTVGPADFNLLATYFGASQPPPPYAARSAASDRRVTARVAAPTLQAADSEPAKTRPAARRVTTLRG
jgi:autotransporter-associated beta strand protein